jgi:hypothetical protein
MDQQTINDPVENFFVIDNVSKNRVDGSVLYYPTYLKVHYDVAVFTPDNDLIVGREYVATVTTDVKDTSGKPLASDYSWRFWVAPALVLASTDISGSVGTGNDGANNSSIDATGEYIVFVSKENLAGHDTGGIAQIYRKNTVTGRIELVSTNSNNELADGPCATPRISDNTRYVVFASTAGNLDPSITLPSTGISHIYRKDMREGTIALLDVQKGTTTAGDGDSYIPDISAQGNYVVFESTATKLLGVDANGDPIDENNAVSDIFRYNVNASAGKRIEIVSIATSGAQTQSDGSFNPRISGDGQRVVFESQSNDLVNEPLYSYTHIFLHDHVNPATVLISKTSEPVDPNEDPDPANSHNTNADINFDGNYIVFQSGADNLATNDGQSYTDIYLRDVDNKITTWLSANVDGNEADGDSKFPSINEDGRYVAFQSKATDLLISGSSGRKNIFATDVTNGNMAQLSVDEPGAVSPIEADMDSSQPEISSNGRYISFSSLATNLNASDPAGLSDIYRAYNAALP